MTADALIHVIDTNPEIRSCLRQIIQSANLALRIHDSAGDFLDSLGRFRPGCVILNLKTLDIDGFAMLQHLRDNQRDIPVIAMTGHAEVPAVISSMKLGAVDIILRPFDPPTLLLLIQKAIRTSVEMHERHCQSEAVRARLAKLTARERELLRLIAAGYSNKQIAGALNISIKTVVNHRSHLLAKTDAVNAAELARLSTIADLLAPE